MAQHLILIRGNSATGKTTLAAALQRAMGRGTANVGQDHLRRVVLREHDVPGGDNIGLIDATARHCLRLGYHVIVEGILIEQHYGAMLRQLVADHAGPDHAYYLDLPLEVTMRRHEARPLAAEVPVEKLRDWFHPRDLLGLDTERCLDAARPVDDLVAEILGDVGPVESRVSGEGARFL